MTKKCSSCGGTISNDAKFCKNCGEKINNEETVQTIEPATVEKVPVNGLSIAGFVLALISLICCGLTSPIGLILSIIGLVKGEEEDRTGKGLAIAGIIISAIMIIFFIISIILWNGFFNIVEDVINDIDLSELNNIIESAVILR